MTTQTENSKWILIYARASVDICLNLLQIFSCRHNSCTWRESPRTRRVSDRSEVVRAGRQKSLLKIEFFVFFWVPQSGHTCANLSDLAKVQRLLKCGRCYNTRIPSNFKGDPTIKFLVSFLNFLSSSYLDRVLKSKNWISNLIKVAIQTDSLSHFYRLLSHGWTKAQWGTDCWTETSKRSSFSRNHCVMIMFLRYNLQSSE